MSFGNKVSEDALVASGRHCCICHKFCGLKIELHHIKQQSEGGSDTFENCIPLCFDCHADMRSTDHNHPKGKKYTEKELIRHRDNWYSKCKNTSMVSSGEHIEQDKHLIQVILNHLKPKGVIQLLRVTSLSEPVSHDDTKPLFYFDHYLSDYPWDEFFDHDLEVLRQELVQKYHSLMTSYVSNTFPIKSSPEMRMNCVPSEWELRQPERYDNAIKEINNNQIEFLQSYEKLLRNARSRLGIIIE